jgi:hypothetical protein
MSTQDRLGSSFIVRIIRAIADAFRAQCAGVCEQRDHIRWLSVR